ncbi:hypothetical protein Neosp_012450 [[Neocosmospora] mangrovei]
MAVVTGVTPSFEKAPAESSAWNNAYEVDTGNDFTLEVATEGNFFIGLASSPDGASSVPTATFKPEPLPKKPLAVDFTVRGPAVVINHNPDGKLVIAK